MRQARRVPVLLAVGALALVGAACGFKQEPRGALGTTYPAPLTDAFGNALVVPRAPARVVSLDQSATRLLEQLGERPLTLGPDASASRIARERPDLVIVPGARDREAPGLAAALHVPVFVMAMARLAAIEHAVFELGIATDRPGRGRALALSLRAQRRAIAARIAGDPVVRAFVDTGFGLPPPRASLVAGLVDDARGDPLAAGTSRALSPREIAGLHPEVYLADGSPQATLHIVRRSRAGRRMRALTEGRVLVLNPRELVPDDRAYTALRRIAAALHPEVFR